MKKYFIQLINDFQLSAPSGYQFSVFRMIFGFYLFCHFIYLIPYTFEVSAKGQLPHSSPLNLIFGIFPRILGASLGTSQIIATVFAIIGALLSLALAVGFKRHFVSFILWFLWACLLNTRSFISNLSLLYISWILFVMVLSPSGEPWSSQRKTPNKEWKMPYGLYLITWIIFVLGYSISGYDKLINPIYLTLIFGLAFLFLCFSKKGRMIVWISMIFLHFSIHSLMDFFDLFFAMLMIHLFTFDTNWFRDRSLFFNQKKASDHTAVSPILFFDGVCGLCNSFVDFIFKEDLSNQFLFSPLQSDFAQQSLPSSLLNQNSGDADFKSVVVKVGDKLYTKSNAVLQVIKYIGGFWILGLIFYMVPRFLRDLVYDLVASHRYSFFGKKDLCRMPTTEERQRFKL